MKRNCSLFIFLSILVLVASCGKSAAPAIPSDSVGDGPSTITFQVRNPIEVDRQDEFIRLSLSSLPADWQADQLQNLEVIRLDGSDSILLESAIMDPGIVLPPSREIQNLEIVFVDTLPAGQSHTYQLRLDPSVDREPDPIRVNTLQQGEMGDLIQIQTGEWTFFIGHELEPLDLEYNGQLPRNLYVRLENDDSWAKFMPLSHIYFSIPDYRVSLLADQCENLFVISPGLPAKIDITSNDLTARILLEYSGWVQGFCPPYDQLEEPEPVDFYQATVELTFYRDLSRVDSHTEITLQRGFYNHSGFAMGGVETPLDRPQVLFGDTNHTVLQGALWADTEETTDRTEFMQIEDARFVFKRAATRDAFGPFETLAESDHFNDYYVVEGRSDMGIFAYFPGFAELAYPNERNEGETVLPVNMVAAGPSVPVMVPNPIILSQSHLGKLGDLWVPIAPGNYAYDLIADLSVDFDTDAAQMYDDLAIRLSHPLEIELVPQGDQRINLREPTATFPPPRTSTPQPSPTVQPTPVLEACDPGLSPGDGSGLIAGSYLDFLADSYDPRVSIQDSILVIDNSGNSGFLGFDREPLEIPCAFKITVNFAEATESAISLSGRTNQAGMEWWEDIHRMYLWGFESGLHIEIRDGVSEGSMIRFSPPTTINVDDPFSIVFADRFGNSFFLLDKDGNFVSQYNMADLANIHLPNGLFPEGVLYFGVLVDPGSQLKIKDLSVSLQVE
jgi:hypothetical protein